MFETEEYVQSARAAGANGYVAKDSTPGDLCAAAVDLAQGKHDLIAIPGPSPGDAPNRSPALSDLTTRELEVLRALATGASNAAIARSLGISPKTLRNHVSNTYHKLGIYDRAQAVIVAVREGLVDVPPR
jgi:DNA-binding NarL/FixJ family response regulator